jgi:magnesium transporter
MSAAGARKIEEAEMSSAEQAQVNTPAHAISSALVGERNGFRWFHVDEPRSPVLDALAVEFHLHERAVEDCRNLRQRAKLEEYEGHVFLIINTLHFEPEKCDCWFGELDAFVGKDWVITVYSGPSRTINTVRSKFDADPKLAHPGRLLMTLLDVAVDRYLPVLDTMEESIEKLEEAAYERPSPKLLAEIFTLKRALIDFRRVASLMREVVNQILYRTEPYFKSQQAYFRNVYDHVVRALDFAETYRDILTGVLDVHLTATANRTNETMKVLTIIATLGTPFLLVTGFYGMNFTQSMPLLDHPFGVAVATILMVLMGLVMLWYFKRKAWI